MAKKINRRSAKDIQEIINNRERVSPEYLHSASVLLADNDKTTTLTIVSHSASIPLRSDFHALGQFALKLQDELRADPEAHHREVARRETFNRLFGWNPTAKGVHAK